MFSRITLIAAVIAAILSTTATTDAYAKSAVYTGLIRGVAVGGYDPVAYFKAGKPVKGSKTITTRHKGATWRFSSPQNRQAFLANPAKYAPQYGGYCAWAVSQGYTAKGDPRAWSIVGGKLYLNYNKAVRRSWEKNTARNIRKGNANWPKVISK